MRVKHVLRELHRSISNEYRESKPLKFEWSKFDDLECFLTKSLDLNNLEYENVMSVDRS